MTREQLHGLVWSKPVTQVAQTMEVSASYLARVCNSLRVPKPARGYWAKLAVGGAPQVQPLPEPRTGQPLEWSKELGFAGAALTNLTIAPPVRRHSSSARPRGIHPLLRGVQACLEGGRPVEAGAYCRPFKARMVDITTSKTGMDTALGLANDLLNALESAGYPVTLPDRRGFHQRARIDVHELSSKPGEREVANLWGPDRPTLVYVGGVAVGLAIVEMSECALMRHVDGKYVRDADYKTRTPRRYSADYTWTVTRDVPSGRFRIIAYVPRHDVSWSRSWQDSPRATLPHQVPSIVKAMKEIAVDVARLTIEADERQERARQERIIAEERWRREEDLRRVQLSIKESREQLDEIIAEWGYVKSLEEFFKGVEATLTRLPAHVQEGVAARLVLARAVIGLQDPLTSFMEWKAPHERYQPRYPLES